MPSGRRSSTTAASSSPAASAPGPSASSSATRGCSRSPVLRPTRKWSVRCTSTCRRCTIRSSICCRPQGVRLTPRHYAYLKIAEGCNNRCSFCIIPAMRGRAGEPAASMTCMREAERLAHAGVKELLVISQDTSAYGADLRYAPGSWRGQLVRHPLHRSGARARGAGRLGAPALRLSLPARGWLIPLMAEGRVLPYLDIPFQHGSACGAQAHAPAGARGRHARAHPRRGARTCPAPHPAQHLHRGLPGETEAEFAELLAGWTRRSSIASAASSTPRWRARPPTRCPTTCPRRSRRSATRASWSAPPPSVHGGWRTRR